MSWLLDVNVILASRWQTHPDHRAVSVWLSAQPEFHTTPIVELGFMRVSLSPAYSASWQDAQHSLTSLFSRPQHHFLPDDLSATDSPETNCRYTTGAHLIRLANRHGLKLATLDTAPGLEILDRWGRIPSERLNTYISRNSASTHLYKDWQSL